jgi:acetolactate decarboxylase
VTTTDPPVARVAWAGAQRDVLAGDLRATVGLTELQHLPHLYALGPLEGLTGEISVFDGVPAIARVRAGDVTVDCESGARACFLVYADVPSWQWTTVAAPLDGKDLTSEVPQRAAGNGVASAGAPLAFLLRGMATELVYHVLDKQDGLSHSPERHEAIKVRFTLRDREVEVLGFHSSAHRGIFTPADSDIHMHFRSLDGRASGHVERLAMAPGWALGRPALEDRD